MDDLVTLLELTGLFLVGVALLGVLIWVVYRDVNVIAVIVGAAVLGIGVAELTGTLVRDSWTVARLAGGSAFVILGIAARRPLWRPMAERALTVLAVAGLLASCAGLFGEHPRRAMTVGLGSAIYLTGVEASAGAAGTALIYLCLELAGHIVPADRWPTAVFGVALLAMAFGAYRWPATPRLKRAAIGIFVAASVWAIAEGHLTTNMPPAQDAAVSFALVFWSGGRARAKAEDPSPASQ